MLLKISKLLKSSGTVAITLMEGIWIIKILERTGIINKKKKKIHPPSLNS